MGSIKLRKAVYWTVDEGMWSPRDQRWGWRQFDSFETEAEARKAVRDILKQSPGYALMLTKVEMLEAWNTERPAWDKEAAMAASKEEEPSDG